MAPCSALRENSGGLGTLGVDGPRREEVAGGQHGLLRARDRNSYPMPDENLTRHSPVPDLCPPPS
eukprot:8858803-Lingulodinium_polyedra.AAC.1